MGINLRGPARTMPRQLPDIPDIHSVLQQMGRKGMSQAEKGDDIYLPAPDINLPSVAIRMSPKLYRAPP